MQRERARDFASVVTRAIIGSEPATIREKGLPVKHQDKIQLLCGDSRDKLRQLRKHSIDAIVTDPPYALKFMGKAWDTNQVACDVKFWKECWRVLKPGGHLVAFGATRTNHRMVCAIEDAGFEIRDSLMWIYGSGFPKNRIALKPAFEPIMLARKPLSEKTIIANVLKWGTGALNIDECRIATNENLNGGGYSGANRHDGTENWRMRNGGAGEFKQPSGRWPANVIHDGSDEVVRMFPTQKSGGYPPKGGQRTRVATYGKPNVHGEKRFGSSEGSAARFFYCAKASKADRAGSKHPTVKPIKLMRWLVRLATPPGGMILDPFAGSGATGAAARIENFDCILIENDRTSQADIRRRLKRKTGG